MTGGSLERPVEAMLPDLEEAFRRHEVVLAYLYGSQARGGAGPLSDVDVAVLFPSGMSRQERGDRRLALNSALMSVFRRNDVFVADLSEATPLLADEVRREGRLLHCSDPAIRIEFEVRALREYVDTQPLRRIRRLYLWERIEQGRLGRYP